MTWHIWGVITSAYFSLMGHKHRCASNTCTFSQSNASENLFRKYRPIYFGLDVLMTLGQKSTRTDGDDPMQYQGHVTFWLAISMFMARHELVLRYAFRYRRSDFLCSISPTGAIIILYLVHRDLHIITSQRCDRCGCSINGNHFTKGFMGS